MMSSSLSALSASYFPRFWRRGGKSRDGTPLQELPEWLPRASPREVASAAHGGVWVDTEGIVIGLAAEGVSSFGSNSPFQNVPLDSFTEAQLSALLKRDMQLIHFLAIRLGEVSPARRQFLVDWAMTQMVGRLASLRGILYFGTFYYASELLREASTLGLTAGPEARRRVRRKMRMPWLKGRGLLALLLAGGKESVSPREIEEHYDSLCLASVSSALGLVGLHRDVLRTRRDLSVEFMRERLRENSHNRERLLAFACHPEVITDTDIRLAVVESHMTSHDFSLGVGLFRGAGEGALESLLMDYARKAPSVLSEVLRDEYLRPRHLTPDIALQLLQTPHAGLRLATLTALAAQRVSAGEKRKNLQAQA